MKYLPVILISFITFSSFGQDNAEELLSKIEVSEDIYLDSLYLELYHFYKKDDPELAYSYAEKSLEFAKRFNNYLLVSEAYYVIGLLHSNTFEYDLAEKNFNLSLDYAQNYGFDERILIAYANIGIVNFQKSDYDKSIDYSLKSLEYAEKLNDLPYQSALLNNIGLVHYRLSDYNEANYYYQQSLNIKEELNLEQDILISYFNIGLCFNGLKDYPKAIEYFQYILDNCNNCNETQIIDSNYGLGKAYYGLESYEKALSYFKLANDMAIKAKYPLTIANTHRYIAKTYFELNDYNRALENLKISEQISKEYKFIQIQRDNFQLYSQIFEEIGNYQKALEYNNLFVAYKDSIISEEVVQNLKDIYVKFQQSRSDEIIQLKDDAIERSQLFMFMLGIILVLLIIVLVFAYRSLTLRSRLNKKLDGMVKDKTKELRNSNEQLIKSRSELDSFLYRTSHDIRGPIATLMGLTRLAKVEAKETLMSTYLEKIDFTAESLNEIISRLTNVSQINSQPLQVKKTNIYQTINEIVSELKPEDLQGVSFKLAGPPPEHIKTDKILLKIILESLLENSFKFSDSNEKNSFVKLDIQLNGNLELIVTDNGVGIEPEFKDKIFDLFFVANEKDRGSGIGLYQAQLATQKLHGNIKLISNKKPTKFKLVFPDISEELKRIEEEKEAVVS